jgi:DNA polymerase elongation subunit (family B)
MSYLSTTATPLAQTNSRNELLAGTYAAIDTEYRFDPNNNAKPYTLFAASIVDSTGNVKVRHESNFSSYPHPEKELVEWLMQEILKYRLTIGWYSKGVRLQNKETGTFSGKDSDLKIIDDAYRYYNIPSIIGFDKRGIPYVRGYDYHLCTTSQKFAFLNKFDWYYHIDLYQIYKKPMIKTMIYNNKYRDLNLASVSKALLGEGKLEELGGLQIQSLSKEKQIDYVAQDANLVMKLSKHNNYEILDLMNAISVITNVPFDKVCHTGISTWWKKIIIDKINSGDCRVPISTVKNQKYKGGQVISPQVGDYKNQLVYVLDVKSLYPTMMIINNISFETVNCHCCKDKPEARISIEIMDLINKDLPKDQMRERYWICKEQNYKGIIPRLLTQYREERFRKQELGDEPTQLALKNLINGIYGLFGSKFFEFSDYRVAELTTAFGRQTLQYMQHIAEEVYGLKVIYGDTDSIFVTDTHNESDINKFLAECSIVLEDVDIEISKVYKRTIITKKKHYIGIHKDSNEEPDVKGMEGSKSDRPAWINQLQKEFVDDLRHDRNPTIKLRDAYIEMERGLVPYELLAITTVLKKDPDAYSKNAYQRIIGSQIGAKEGDAIKYYKSTNCQAHSNPALLSRAKYLDMMNSTFEEQLKVLGYDFMKDVIGIKRLADIL